MSPISAAELQGMEFPEPRWAVPGLLPQGLTLLVSKPKLGKSWWLLNVAIAVATGGKALGSIDTEPGDVLYLALEDSPRRLQDRMMTLLADEDEWPANLYLETTWPRLDAGGGEQLTAWLLDHPNARLVAADTLEKLRAPRKATGTLYEQDYAALGSLKAIADESGIALVASHHDRKAGALDAFDTISGTQGLAAAADALLVMKRARNEELAQMHVTGRDIEEAQHSMRWSAAAGTWTILDWLPAAAIDASEGRRMILAALGEKGRAAPTEIAAWTGQPIGTVKRLTTAMARDGLLAGGGRDGYSVVGTPLYPEPIEPKHSPGSTGSHGSTTQLGSEGSGFGVTLDGDLVAEVTRIEPQSRPRSRPRPEPASPSASQEVRDPKTSVPSSRGMHTHKTGPAR